jgi:hypothetical protein
MRDTNNIFPDACALLLEEVFEMDEGERNACTMIIRRMTACAAHSECPASGACLDTLKKLKNSMCSETGRGQTWRTTSSFGIAARN